MLAPEEEETKEHYRGRCYAFFTAIFITLVKHLNRLRSVAQSKNSTVVEEWRDMMDATRAGRTRETFFRDMEAAYNDVCHHTIIRSRSLLTCPVLQDFDTSEGLPRRQGDCWPITSYGRTTEARHDTWHRRGHRTYEKVICVCPEGLVREGGFRSSRSQGVSDGRRKFSGEFSSHMINAFTADISVNDS